MLDQETGDQVPNQWVVAVSIRGHRHRTAGDQALRHREGGFARGVGDGPVRVLDGDAKVRGGDEHREQVVADPAVEGHRAPRPGKPLEPGATLALPEHVQPEVGIPDPLDGLDHGCEVAGAVEHAAGQKDAVLGLQPEAAPGIGLVARCETSSDPHRSPSR